MVLTRQQATTARKGMVWVAGGTFWMGSDDHYREERPSHLASVDGFWIDAHAVTVAQFRRFVASTGYVTTAEQEPNADAFPGVDSRLIVPGSMVFTPPRGRVSLDDYRRWWSYVPGADWRHPEGPGSNVGGRDRHPVTHVSYLDACAFADWAGKLLPTEVEWEYAARGGLDRAEYVWGAEREPRGRPAGNVWQGDFPWQDLAEDGYAGTSPTGRFRANGYGLYDMAGNVWEWTADYFTESHADAGGRARSGGGCCVPTGPPRAAPGADAVRPRRVVKGGSYLCSPNYCDRYRPAARQFHEEDASTCHIGFRCVSHEYVGSR